MKPFRRPPPTRQLPPPTQDHIPLREIQDGLIIRHDGALIQVIGVRAINMITLDDGEQTRIIAEYDALLKNLPFGWQTHIVARPQDIEPHLAVLRDIAHTHQQQGHIYYHQLLLGYIDFLNQLAWDSMALVREYYLVLAYLHPGIESLRQMFGKRTLTAKLLAEGREELDHMVGQVRGGFANMGLETWALNDDELKRELYLFYHPALQAEEVDLPPGLGPDRPAPRTIQGV